MLKEESVWFDEDEWGAALKALLKQRLDTYLARMADSDVGHTYEGDLALRCALCVSDKGEEVAPCDAVSTEFDAEEIAGQCLRHQAERDHAKLPDDLDLARNVVEVTRPERRGYPWYRVVILRG